MRKVSVANDKGSTFGLQSEHRQGYKSGLTGHIVDHKNVIKLYIGQGSDAKCIVDKTTNVKSLKTQADKKHSDGGYVDVPLKVKMPKMSTGTKLATKLQGKIDTSHISKPLVIPTTPYPGSIQILQTGNIIFKQLTPRGYTDLVLGKVTDYYYQGEKLVFNWNYYENSKKYECNQLNRAIDKHMGIDRKETLRIVASNNQQSKLSKNAKKKLARATVR